MLTLAGCRLPDVLFSGPDLLICGGTREDDGTPVRVRLLHVKSPSPSRRAAWQAELDRVAANAAAWGERLLDRRAVGDVDALLLADDGRRPLGATLATAGPMPVERALRLALDLLARASSRAAAGPPPPLHAASVWVRDADTRVALVLAGDDAATWAPERWAGIDDGDERAQFFAVGALLFQMLTATAPFGADSGASAAQRRPPELRAVRPEVPAAVARVVARCLAKDRAERYQSRYGLEADLRALAEAIASGQSTDGIALGAADDAARFELPAHLYGREHELELLRLALDRSRWGWTAPVLLSGAPGIGKSALPAALRDEVERDGGRYVSGKFDQYKRTVPYSAVVEAATQLVQQILAASDDEVAALRARIAQAVGPNARVLADVAPALEWLLDTLPPAPPLGPTETRNRFNAALKSFIRCIATPEHPLVFLLDDLQWADGASLALFTTLATDTTLPHLLLVGAYRDRDAGQSVLLPAMLDELRAADIQCTAITVGPIAERDVLALVTDTVRRPAEACRPLAALVHERTGGNPFFARQFLRALVEDGALAFDPAAGHWDWDLAAASARAVSESVTDLMTDRFARLPSETQAALRLASCIGSRFAPRIVADVQGVSEAQVAASLEVAVAEGLVQRPLDGGDARWGFVHDRVQQAAHAAIPEAERAEVRARIGRTMQARLSADELDEALFEVVANLADGVATATDAEAATFAALCLRAGERARASLAYEDAYTFLGAGLAAVERVAVPPALGFGLRSALFECAYLTGRFDEAESLLARLVRDAPDVATRTRIQNTKIVIDTAQGRSVEAVRLGIAVARSLGVHIPEQPSLVATLWGVVRVQLALRSRKPAALRDLPRLEDPERLAAIGALLRIGPAAYFNNPGAFLLSNLAIVRLSLAHGHGPGSSFGYIIYAMVLGAKLGNAPLGHDFGQLAIALSDRLDPPDIRPKIYLIYGAFVSFWSRPYAEGIRIMADAFAYATEAGDLQYACYCHQSTIALRLAFGAPLDDLATQSERYLVFARQAKDEFPIDGETAHRQGVLALLGRTASLTAFDTPEYDEAAWLVRVRAGGNLTTLGYWQTAKLMCAWVAGNLDLGLEVGAQALANLDALLSQIHVAQVHLYYGLAMAAALRDPVRAGRVNRRHLATCRKVLARHAADAPSNFAPWHRLLEAMAASAGDEGQLAAFDAAIASAREHGQPHIVAMAAEAAARRQLAAGRRTVAEGYLKDAISGYEQWKASAKVSALVTEFAELLPDRALAMLMPSGPVRRFSAAVPSADRLVLAARELATEPDFEKVLQRLLALALEGGGGDRGQLLLRRDGRLVTVAEDDGEQGTRALAVPVTLANDSGLCAPLVQSAVRRRQAVVVADALSDPQYGATPYVKDRRPRSIACVPVLLGDEVAGALYVENTGVAGMITPERERLLALLAGEVALAVDRSRLAEAARESREALGSAMRRVEVLEKSKAHLGKFVPASVQRIIDANPDAPALEKRERDVTILFLDIEGYTALSETLPRERLDWLVRTYFSRFLDAVHEHRGEVNETAGDGLMILFQDDDANAHAVNAVRAALAIRVACRALNDEVAGQVPPVTVNIGINSGAALVGSTRLQGEGGARWTFTATGSVTNVAARLGAFATHGQVVVSEATARRLGRAFALAPLGAQPLKNVREPVVLYDVLDHGATA